MHRRFQIIIVSLLLAIQGTASFASDWAEDNVATEGSISPITGKQAAQSLSPSLPPFANQMQLQEAAKSGALKLHFAQALEALEIEIFAKKNLSDDVTQRLNLLEKAVFGTGALADLDNNMVRLTRLLNAVALSQGSIETAAHVTHLTTSKQSSQNFGDMQNRGVLSRVLHSPSFWILVGVTGAVIGAYLLSRNSAPYSESRYINPDQYYVGPYQRNGQWVGGGMRTRANGITSDNLSGH